MDGIDIAPAYSIIAPSSSATVLSLTINSVEYYPEQRGAGVLVEIEDQETWSMPNSSAESDTETDAESDANSMPDSDKAWRPFENEVDYALAM